jgi:hypothetical protein
MNQVKAGEKGYESRIRTSTIRLALWTCAWLAATALMAFGPNFVWNKAPVFTLLAIGLDVAVGIGMILANKKYLEELDELQRKVQLNALAVALGVGLIAGIPYSMMDAYDVIPFKPHISHLLMLMSLTYFVSCLYGSKQYR